MKPTEFIPFRSLPLKVSQRNPDSDSAEPSGNLGQPSNILDISNGDNSGNGNSVPIHPETPTTSVLQPEAELDQPVNPNQHYLRWKKKRKINSSSTSENVNPDELKEKETAEETSIQNRSPQQFEEEIPQVQSLPTSSQPHTDDADNKFWQLYYNWRAWKVGNSEEQLLDWDQQLKNEKIIKKCLGIPVNHNCEDILNDYWVWQKNPEDLHMEYLANTPVSDCEADDEDTAVFKPVFSKATEDQMAPTSEEIAVLETTAEDFPIFPETSPAFEMISNQTQLEILEKSAEIPEQSAIPEIMEKAVEVQRHSGKVEKETQMAEVEVSQTPIAIFEEPNEAEDSDSLSRYISNFALDEAEGESERTLKITDDEDVQEDAESLPLQLFQRTSSPHQKVQGLIESALASQHASFRQEIELMEAKHTELIEKSEEKHSADLKEISKSVEKTLEIISLLSKTVSNTMEIYTSDSQLQFNEFNKVKEQIANVTVSLQKQMSLLQMDIRSALAIASANQVVTKDYLKVIIDNQKEAYKLFRLIGAHSGNRKMEIILQQHSPSPIPQLPIAVNEGEASYVPSHLHMTNLILEAQQRNPENSAQHLSSSGLDGTEFIGAVADHFSDDAQSEERRENLRRIKELCGNMQGISEVAGSSKRKRN
ncbi:unnamed protein product [Cuscuta campestris]|uniref:Uncharacterized protein n=1 Tax=Cuscuta campestris TaxID=132261 RepID=A0A484LSJ7_9ASTE|nr:unnamed protein product [Cuscuta campestris]